MSIRKLWLIVLILVATLSIAINALILTSLTDRYFKTYLSETYDEHIDQMITYVVRFTERREPSPCARWPLNWKAIWTTPLSKSNCTDLREYCLYK
jgi:hypothetical protein